MSGIEVAGLVLGALPILFAAIDISRFSRAGLAFQKRKKVEKLARALLLQQQTLEETVKSVVMASGCEEVWRLDEDPYGYLNDEAVGEEFLEYLGSKNNAAFTGALEQSCQIVKRIAKGITGLVPSFKGAPDDLIAVITAKKDVDGWRLDLIPRVKLVFGMNDLKEAVKELDITAGALDRFTRILLSNGRSVEEKSSKRAIKLAKALRDVRKFACTLCLAIFHGWRIGCHRNHEARLVLEDRVDVAPEILKQIGKVSALPILAFQLQLAAGVNQELKLWHETAVQVFNNYSDDSSQPPMVSRNSGSSQVTFTATKTAASVLKPNITSVGDICGALDEAKIAKQHIAFVLDGNKQMGMISTDKETIFQYHQASTVTVKALLSTSTTRRQGHILPWKSRMLIALRLASNLLQLFQTEWLQNMVYFEFQRASNGAQHHLQVDLGRPFVSLICNDSAGDIQPRSVESKMALLELVIMLLEVWHETTLETRFGLEEAPKGYYQRLARAAEWLDDTENSLPDLYDRDVSHCIQRPVVTSASPIGRISSSGVMSVNRSLSRCQRTVGNGVDAESWVGRASERTAQIFYSESVPVERKHPDNT